MTQAFQQLHRPESTNFSIPRLVDLALDGTIRIPRFQRNFVWDERNVRELFDSIWRGFPIGTLLLWKSEAEAGTVEFGPLRVRAPKRTDALWVVDGQQRITSLVGALTTNFRGVDFRFDVYFDLRRGRFVTSKKGSVPPTWLPLNEALETRRLLSWLRDHEADLEPRDYDAADALGGALRDYQVPAYIVVGNDDLLLRQIFDRVNSAGKPIGRAEIFHALFAGDTDPGSPAKVVASLKRHNFGRLDPDRVVQSLLALRGGNVQRDLHEEFADGDNLAEWYEKTEESLGRAITFLRDQGIPHLLLMPSTLPLPVLAALFYLHPEPELWTQRLIARWLWRGWTHGFGRRGQTPALRQAIGIVNPKKGRPLEAPNEFEACKLLLATVPDEEPQPLRIDPFRTETAGGRLALLALSSLNPLDPNGRPLDIASALDRYRVQAITELVPGRRGEIGARGFWPADATPLSGSEFEEVLASHAIDKTAARYLRSGEIDMFVKARGQFVEKLAHRFLSARVEAKRPVRRSLSSLIISDEDEEQNG